MSANKPSAYYGSIPAIAQAYQNSPSVQLAKQSLAEGTSTAPVAGRGWAVPDGIARIGQALLGQHMLNKQNKKFASREEEYMAAMAEAAKAASNPATGNPATGNPATGNPATVATNDVASALGGTMAQQAPVPIEAFTPPPSTPATPPAAPPAALPAALPAAPTAQGGPQPPPASPVDPQSLYFGAIVPIEGGTDPKTGAFRTSPKGAIGPGQVMPGTAPEAARLAGLEFNDTLYRTDADYNNKLGLAYFTKQLEDFGDPLKAAAAYNAGPGRVRRAIRRANKNGGSWQDYVPSETKKYISNFAAKSGDAGSAPQAVQVVAQPLQMEQVPEGVASAGAMPEGYDVPDAVESNRITIAQQMLASGNPDLAVIAQQYLDSGLAEQNAARVQTNQQQNQRNRDVFGVEADEFAASSAAVRTQQLNDRASAQDRNFSREQTNTANNFARETREDEQAFTSSENERTRRFNSLENQKARAYGQAKTGRGRNPYFDTPTGLKLQDERDARIAGYRGLITNLERFKSLNQKQGTGGLYAVPGVASVAGFVGNDDLSELDSLTKRITLEELGGLGIAISDGDRDFVVQAMPNVKTGGNANRNVANILIATAERKIDFEYANTWWRANNSPDTLADFDNLYKAYAQSNPLFELSDSGDTIIRQGPSFRGWLEGAQEYDAEGNLVR